MNISKNVKSIESDPIDFPYVIMNPKMRTFLLIIFMLTIMSSCGSSIQLNSEEKSFLNLSDTQRRLLIENSPIETQIHLYLLAMRTIHPDLNLPGVLASNGDKILPQLLQKLIDVESNENKINLLEIFDSMQRNGHYDILSNDKLMQVIQTVINTIDGNWRDYTRVFIINVKVKK